MQPVLYDWKPIKCTYCKALGHAVDSCQSQVNDSKRVLSCKKVWRPIKAVSFDKSKNAGEDLVEKLQLPDKVEGKRLGNNSKDQQEGSSSRASGRGMSCTIGLKDQVSLLKHDAKGMTCSSPVGVSESKLVGTSAAKIVSKPPGIAQFSTKFDVLIGLEDEGKVIEKEPYGESYLEAVHGVHSSEEMDRSGILQLKQHSSLESFEDACKVFGKLPQSPNFEKFSPVSFFPCGNIAANEVLEEGELNAGLISDQEEFGLGSADPMKWEALHAEILASDPISSKVKRFEPLDALQNALKVEALLSDMKKAPAGKAKAIASKVFDLLPEPEDSASRPFVDEPEGLAVASSPKMSVQLDPDGKEDELLDLLIQQNRQQQIAEIQPSDRLFSSGSADSVESASPKGKKGPMVIQDVLDPREQVVHWERPVEAEGGLVSRDLAEADILEKPIQHEHEGIEEIEEARGVSESDSMSMKG